MIEASLFESRLQGKKKPLKKVTIATDQKLRGFSFQNIRGPYLMSRSFLPLLLKGSGKTVLNITSAGADNVFPGASGYQMTKLALLRFSEFINAEYGEQGVVSFSLHPGGVITDVARNMPQAVQDRKFGTFSSKPWIVKESD